MAENYRCGDCGGTSFYVSTAADLDGKNNVYIDCNRSGCHRDAEAASVAQAFEAISAKPKEEKA